MIPSKILIDTSVLIDFLRGNISSEVWLKTLEGRAPALSPVTIHEFRRGIVPGSKWEKDKDFIVPLGSILTPPPDTAAWIEAADIIRGCFGKTRAKVELAALAHDVLICLAAKNTNAELWSRDKDFKIICLEIGVTLFDH